MKHHTIVLFLGKKFRFSMVTIGRWKNGKMAEEYIFYDNLAIMKQIGLAK